MTEIRFYHLQKTGLDRALPEILEKAVSTGKNIIVKVPDEGECTRLNDHLWTYRPDSFLPHGNKADGNADQQPVWLSTGDDNPNGAKIIILTGGASSENPADFDLCCEMLNGNDPAAVKAARERWKAYKEQGFDLTYWQQDDNGKWTEKGA